MPTLFLGTSGGFFFPLQFQTTMPKWSRGEWGLGCIRGEAFNLRSDPLCYHPGSDVDLPRRYSSMKLW